MDVYLSRPLGGDPSVLASLLGRTDVIHFYFTVIVWEHVPAIVCHMIPQPLNGELSR